MSPQEAVQILQQAVADHQAGRGAQAEAAYRRVLAAQPNNADALHLLGVLATQHGHAGAAVPLIQRAIAIVPHAAQFHFHLAQALAAMGRHPEALSSYQTAIQLDPRDALTRSEAAASLTEIGRTPDALEQYRIAVELAPNNAGIAGNYGLALTRAGQTDKGIAMLRRAVSIDPKAMGPHLQLGEALWHTGQYEEAAEIACGLVERDPTDRRTWILLGNAYQTLARFDEAVEVYQKVMDLDPDNFDAFSNIALTLLKMGEAKRSLEMYDQAIARWPQRVDAQANRSLAKLTLGDLSGGFAEYETRWKSAAFAGKPSATGPRWHGEDPRGKTILLTTEQGMGDVIQFIRYAPLIADRGARVFVSCAPELKPVIATVVGIDRIFTGGVGEKISDANWYAPIASLPHIFHTTVQTIPAEVPYVAAEADRVARWRERLAQDDALNVGIVWAGTPLHQNDRARSCKLSDFSPLAAVEGVHWYSLQKGPAVKQLDTPPAGMKITHLGDELHDFGDTAALLQCLDVLISVDTSVVHLGGALARPVWALLARGPDWRWMLDRDDSPWYPTLRLFRQTRSGEWGPVLERAAEALREFAGQQKKEKENAR
jgi:tetratricopeptide (TPR) repeat protein